MGFFFMPGQFYICGILFNFFSLPNSVSASLCVCAGQRDSKTINVSVVNSLVRSTNYGIRSVNVNDINLVRFTSAEAKEKRRSIRAQLQEKETAMLTTIKTFKNNAPTKYCRSFENVFGFIVSTFCFLSHGP